jgi:hypothetical protein
MIELLVSTEAGGTARILKGRSDRCHEVIRGQSLVE